MDLVVGDLETYWSTTHSLSRMNPIDYVMHKETEIISLSLKVGTERTMVAFGERNVRNLLAPVNWDDALFVAHNMSGFDALVFAWRLGIRPKLWGCTLAMARPIHAKTTGLSLAKLVKFYGIGEKKNEILIQTRGKHLKDFTRAELQSMGVYNIADTDQCHELFKKLAVHYTAAELWHLDSKIRALVEPQFVVDVPLLEAALVQERARKRESILALGALLGDRVMPLDNGLPLSDDYVFERVRATLASAPMFSQVLESRNVPVPMKPSPTNPEVMIPALAKTDEEFVALQEHDDPIVAAAAACRLEVKSTLAETRMAAFINVAEKTGGHWPCTTNYCGADTTGRASGWLYNPLNMPRVKPNTPRITDALRMSLKAPPGHKVVVADLSSIEMRFNHFLWKVPYSTALWKEDPQADFYRASYAIKLGITPDQVTKGQRQASKVENLALGFGMGARKYVDTARIQTQGEMIITLEQAEADVPDWRKRHREIVDGWKTCDKALEWIYNGIERPIDPHGMFVTCAEGIRMPSGRLIRYPSLRREDVAKIDAATGEKRIEPTWVYGEGRHRAFVYGAKTDENIVQAGARDVVYDVALDFYTEALDVFGREYRPALEVYDELVYIVPDDDAEEFLEILQRRMRKQVAWFPELVTWSEGDIGDRYGEAK